MKILHIVTKYLSALIVVGLVGLVVAPQAFAGEVEDIYNGAKAKGIAMPWNTVGEFQNQMINPCKKQAPSSTTEADCARLVVSCYETVTTQSRCSEPDSIAEASDGGISIGNTLGGDCQGAGLGTANKCFTKWNQEAKTDRWDDEYSGLIANLCKENASKLTAEQAKNCESDGKKVFEDCYRQISQSDPRVPSNKLRDCFNQGFKSKNGIDASSPDTPGNAGVSDPANGGTGTAAGTSKKSVCAIQKIGWLVCPVTEFISWLADKVYAGVAGFMEVRAFSASQDAFSSDSPMMKAWVQMRDIANVLFVVVFLIIIYSQITGGQG